MQSKQEKRQGLMVAAVAMGAAALVAAANAPLASVARASTSPASSATAPQFTDSFVPEHCQFSSVGSNPFFILQPGYVQVYDGAEDGEKVHLTITVTAQTKKVAGVQTRVIEERESHNGSLVEVSRNYFAICAQNNSVFYFGEDVDIYKQGKVTGHGGSWLAGVKGARAGLVMPGLVLLGARFAQEVAPGTAMDRAEIVSLSEVLKTPAGEFKRCLKTEETTPLEPGNKEYKLYASGVGLIEDGTLKLVKVIRPKSMAGQGASSHAAQHAS